MILETVSALTDWIRQRMNLTGPTRVMGQVPQDLVDLIWTDGTVAVARTPVVMSSELSCSLYTDVT